MCKQFIVLQLDRLEKQMKNISQRDNKKDTKKYSTSTYLTALSNRTVKKESREGGPQRKKMNIYLKQKKETISKRWS